MLDGEIIHEQTFAEAPSDFPAEHDDLIFSSVLEAGEVRLMASDNPHPGMYAGGANIVLCLRLAEDDEPRAVFEQLADRGEVIAPLDGGLGMVTDRFGTRWMVTVGS